MSFSHDDKKNDRFRTELVEFALFPKCYYLMSLFLFASCCKVASSITLVLSLDNRTKRSET